MKLIILLIFSTYLIYANSSSRYGITSSLYSYDTILNAQNGIYALQEKIESTKSKIKALQKKSHIDKIEKYRLRRYKIELKELTTILVYIENIVDSRTLNLQEDIFLHQKNKIKQRSLQQKKLEEQLSIINREIENLETKSRLLNSEIDIKTKKRLSIYKQAEYDIDTYLEQIQSLQKKEIMENVSFTNKIEQYKQKARGVKGNIPNEVVRIDKKLKRLNSRLKINVKKLKRYRTNRDEKVNLLNYYNGTE